jgi:hypothetical protein
MTLSPLALELEPESEPEPELELELEQPATRVKTMAQARSMESSFFTIVILLFCRADGPELQDVRASKTSVRE